jgi:hypothetical protein
MGKINVYMQRKPSQALTRQLPRKGETLKNGNLTVLPKSSPFGRAGIEQGEMTERV